MLDIIYEASKCAAKYSAVKLTEYRATASRGKNFFCNATKFNDTSSSKWLLILALMPSRSQTPFGKEVELTFSQQPHISRFYTTRGCCPDKESVVTKL